MRDDFFQTDSFIAIEGPVGAGKTCLANRLASHFGASTILEKPEENPFLPRFYQDQSRFALSTQLHFLFQRLDQLQSHGLRAARELCFCDYLLEKDPLFASMTLSEDEYKLYRRIYDDNTTTPSITPDLVIYLQAPPALLSERIRKRNRDFEKQITDEYLLLLSEGYTKFFHSYNTAPVLVVNSEHMNFIDNDDDFALLLNRISNMRSHREYFNRGE